LAAVADISLPVLSTRATQSSIMAPREALIWPPSVFVAVILFRQAVSIRYRLPTMVLGRRLAETRSKKAPTA